jgi:hypothetical protein
MSGQIQVTYPKTMVQAIPGLIYGNEFTTTTRIAEADIPFGYAVKRGTDKDRQALVGGGADFLGVLVHTLSPQASYTDQTIKGYANHGIDILREGMVMASPSNAVTAGDKVAINTSTGRFKGGEAAVGETQVSNAFWDSSCDADGFAILVMGLGAVGTVAVAVAP